MATNEEGEPLIVELPMQRKLWRLQLPRGMTEAKPEEPFGRWYRAYMKSKGFNLVDGKRRKGE